MKHLAIIILSFTLASSALAQTASTEAQAGTQSVFSENVFGVGLHASLCTGMGLSFRQHFAFTPLAYQITFGIWKTSDLSMYDFGAELQYDLSVDQNRLYALAGGGYYYYGHTANELTSPGRFGIGLGYEIPFSKRIGISLDLIITYFTPDHSILPLPSIAGHIYFK